MNHKQKLKLARRMLTQAEIKMHIAPFMSEWWQKQKQEKERLTLILQS